MTVKKLNQQSFDTHLEENDVIIVKFSAAWCGPCKAMEPMLDELSKEFNNISFVEIDVEESPSLATQFNVRALPTLISWKNGEVQWSKIGMPNLTDLKKDLSKLLENDI